MNINRPLAAITTAPIQVVNTGTTTPQIYLSKLTPPRKKSRRRESEQQYLAEWIVRRQVLIIAQTNAISSNLPINVRTPRVRWSRCSVGGVTIEGMWRTTLANSPLDVMIRDIGRTDRC